MKLEQERSEILGLLAERTGLTIERQPDPLDELWNAMERALTVGTLEMETLRRRQIDAALERIEDGTYGICPRCEEPIDEHRLEAVPWAEMCRRCQERAEEKEAKRSQADST